MLGKISCWSRVRCPAWIAGTEEAGSERQCHWVSAGACSARRTAQSQRPAAGWRVPRQWCLRCTRIQVSTHALRNSARVTVRCRSCTAGHDGQRSKAPCADRHYGQLAVWTILANPFFPVLPVMTHRCSYSRGALVLMRVHVCCQEDDRQSARLCHLCHTIKPLKEPMPCRWATLGTCAAGYST